jgi:hypothetical protein
MRERVGGVQLRFATPAVHLPAIETRRANPGRARTSAAAKNELRQ